MPTVHLALKLEVTVVAFTAKCENSFSVLKTIMRDRRQSINFARKAHLVQLTFESDLTRKLKIDWKENAFQRSSTSNCEQQLFSLFNSVDLVYLKFFGVLCFKVLVSHFCVFF